MNLYKYISKAVMIVVLSLSLNACTKSERDDDFSPGDPPEIAGGYTNSSEVAADDLLVYFPFDGNIDDAKGTVTGGAQHGAVSFITGRKGQAYKGATDAFLSYENPGALTGISSFTVAYWLNTQKHQGGAQGIFMLSREGNFWGNFFEIVEGSDRSNNKMQLKLHFEKPSVPNAEHWIDPGDKYWADDMYGGWRHVVYTYDETTSTVTRYISGNELALPNGPPPPDGDGDIVHRTASGDPYTGVPLGPLVFENATKFVIGGYQNHLGSPYNGLETWMLNYTGAIDEFRIYKRALNAKEVAALYKLERQSR